MAEKLTVTVDVSNRVAESVRGIVNEAILNLLAQIQEVDQGRLSFEAIRTANVSRAERWHAATGGIKGWSVLEWAGSMCGEAGEAANAAKKLKRLDDQTYSTNNPHSRKEAIAKIAEEIGGTFMYLDLLAARCGLSLPDVIRHEFNRISVREAMPERL